MPGTEQLRRRLLKKLFELFQLDQPDLDFGFYRIMHARAREVQDFIGTDLLKIVADAFGDVDEARKAELKAKIDLEIAAAKEYGVPEPENSPKVKEAQAAYAAIKDTAGAEADVYDHLYRFFERYYDDGDFISRRYHTRETSGKAAPFAVPYNGEEVKLHWANADQYYIKSAEYFSNFTFDLRQAKEIRARQQPDQTVIRFGSEDESPLKVHFRIVEATEGEHGNVKASEANKRFFILHAPNPVALTETGELVVHFEYRTDPEKTGQENTWRDKRNAEAVESILDALENHAWTQTNTDENNRAQPCESLVREYLRLFKVPAPTDSDKQRTLLARYVNQYTARNTMDYFIHKDLGGFLRRELDFYIKNEVMHLDDIENADAPAVESYLAKIKVLRKIAGKLIDFLAQLEDFQKKLWLKKKFVVETNHCITLDRVPEELYAEVAANEAQCEEWIRLFAIDEIQANLFNQGFSRPLTIEFLKAHNKLVLDTRFFHESFKARLVASIENLDEQCDGLLIHSENFQALNLLQERYREQVKCVYIDPPYNTGGDGFSYKDSYRHSSWLSLIENSYYIASKLMNNGCGIFTNMDDDEGHYLKLLCDQVFGRENFIRNIVWQKRTSPDMRAIIGDGHDHIFVYAKNSILFSNTVNKIPKSEDQRSNFKNPDNDPRGPWVSSDFTAQGYRPNQMYTIITPGGADYTPPEGRCWKNVEAVFLRLLQEGRMWFGQDGKSVPRRKTYLSESENNAAWSWWTNSEVGHNQEAKKESISFFGVAGSFMTPKPRRLLDRIVHIATQKGDTILDYFAGSGTTGHAVINLNREDGGKRKYILIEMGDYFDTVLKPRIAKVVYSKSWKDGKPTARHTGISHCFKYIRLESYEDTLNNLRYCEEAKDEWIRDFAGVRKKEFERNRSLREDYMLHYLLDVETRGSQSLLNIDRFVDPWSYRLRVKKPGSDEQVERVVDLMETFNYLIGLRVTHMGAPQWFDAEFERMEDAEVPPGQKTKLLVSGEIRQVLEPSAAERGGLWCFRKVEGWVPKDPAHPNNGQREKVLVVWRGMPAYSQLREEGEFEGLQGIEGDNLMLDEWFRKNRMGTRMEFDIIYVNGSNNLPSLKQENETWKVRLIEEEFMKRMWDVEGPA